MRRGLDDGQDTAAHLGAEQVAQVQTDVVEVRRELKLLLVITQQVRVVEHSVDEVSE